jgi:type IV secretion system protein VirB10
MGLGGGAAIVIVGALVWGLHSQKGGGPASKELYNTDNKPPAGQLAGLPHDYASKPRSGSGSAGVPELGPRLPGDLGRPILNAGAPAPVIGASGQEDGSQSGAQSQAEKRRDQAEQRRAQEVDAARISPLFSGRAGASAEAGAALPAVALPAAGVPIPSTGQQNEADRKLAFLNGPLDRQTVSGSRIEPPAGRNIVQAGAVIAAALITGVRSDLPGQVTAQVTEPVYDSPTGKILLIPQGSRLIGQYDAQVQFGQSRALLAWTRLILPNGRSIVLERQPGADPEGYAGLGDQVDDHWGQLFKAAMLSTVLSVGTEAGTSNNENSLVQAIREGASNSFVQTGSQVVGRSLSIQPSITVRPGFPVRVIVTRDLVLEPYKD